MKSIIRVNSLLLLTLMIISTSTFLLPINEAYAAPPSMTFTTGNTMDFTSNTEINFWSGVSMYFGTGIRIQFIEFPPPGNGMIEPCDVIQVLFPPGYILDPCSWWEVLDPMGHPTGFEFHIDQRYGPSEYHIDQVFPGPFPLPLPGGVNLAEKKIDIIAECSRFVVHWPVGWYPAPCSWWEIINPETRQPTGYEFHVDWTNESCEFHVDDVTPGPYILQWPWYEIEARLKIDEIEVCDWLTIIDPVPPDVTACTWWEIMYHGQPTGLEFHIDEVVGSTFHVDDIDPDPLVPPLMYPLTARKKVTAIAPCEWFRAYDPTETPEPCTWWKIVRPIVGDVEFHVDKSFPNGTFHIDDALPTTTIPPNFVLRAEKKIDTIGPCNWFRVLRPSGYLPNPCTYWRITYPPEWAGVTFHVDSNDGVDRFHIDSADTLPPGSIPPPWNVTAELFDPWYYKPAYSDYVPSGMPDFDQRQWGTYMWKDQGGQGQWSHCGPVAVANSLWWLDSEFEPNPIPPPIINDGFPLVMAYGQWDDHSPQNVPWLVEHLAYLMDTDGRRTGLVHSGTNVYDMEAGLAQYLAWTRVNPPGDANGDSEVNVTDANIVNAAMGSVPGAPNWNMAADVFPASTGYPPVADNIIDMQDMNWVLMHMGLKGRFYEHTILQPEFFFIEEEVEKCQDVVLLIGYWVFDTQSGTWYREPGGHYVTVAGVDSTNSKMALSDPVQDAFETGMIPEGRIPVPHIHMPPEPPYVTHNDAALVSQDIYSATTVTPPWPPCPGGNWMLVNFASWRPAPPFFAVIEAAVVTSPLGIHDLAVVDVASTKEGCLPMPNVGQNQTVRVNIEVENQGDFAETFNVTAYAANLLGTYPIGTQQVTLDANTSTTTTIVWNTLGFARSNYTLSATADTVPGETDTADNTHIDGVIWVNLIGDINCDDYVGIDDIFTIASHFAQDPSHPNWNPNCDLNDDDYIGIDDIFMAASHFGQEGP